MNSIFARFNGRLSNHQVLGGIWCLTPLSTIFQIYRGGQFLFWWRKPENPAATRHWQTLLHNVVSSTLRLSGIRTHNVSGDGHWLQVVVNSTTIHSRPRRLPPDSKRMSLISCIPHINTVPNIGGCLQTYIQGRGVYRSVNYIYIIRDYTYPQSHLSLLSIFRCRYVGQRKRGRKWGDLILIRLTRPDFHPPVSLEICKTVQKTKQKIPKRIYINN